MSTQAVRVISGLTTSQVSVIGAAAAVALFTKDATQSGDTGSKSFREFKNLDGALSCYIGPDATVTDLTGHRIDPGQTFTLSGDGGLYMGDLYIYAPTTLKVSKIQY